MKRPATIVVIIAHMDGPLKGQVQQFSQAEITIGRLPSCHVRFPANMTAISRNHAVILREGNRFKLIDKSSNGTLVNGKRMNEIWLKDGDVLSITQGGPQIGFVTELSDIPAEPEDIAPPPQPTLPPATERPAISWPSKPLPVTTPPTPPAPPAPSAAVRPPAAPPLPSAPAVASGEKIRVPLVIQYGPTIRSFREVPVVIGGSPRCDCRLDHPLLLDEHARIFFAEESYWIKDLTGKKLICHNGHALGSQVALQANDEIALTEKGPFFKFLGGGRLAEIDKPDHV